MKKIVRTVGITLVFALVSFYFTLPALNLRSPAFYSWLIEVAGIYIVASLIGTFSIADLRSRTVDFKFLKNNAKAGLIVVILSLAFRHFHVVVLMLPVRLLPKLYWRMCMKIGPMFPVSLWLTRGSLRIQNRFIQ